MNTQTTQLKNAQEEYITAKAKKEWLQQQTDILNAPLYEMVDAGQISDEEWAIKATTTKEAIAIMREREKQQGHDPNNAYNGYTNHDTWNVMLLLENTPESYRWLDNWKANWDKKIKGGRFNPEEAERAVEKYIIPAVKGKKSLQWAVGRDFTPDPDIDAKKVNKAEIVRLILDRE